MPNLLFPTYNKILPYQLTSTMQDFSIWWDAIAYPEKIYWYITIPFTIIFLFQMVLVMMGLDANHDLDMDTDVDVSTDVDASEVAIAGLRIFTLRNIIIFFTMFSWSGIFFSRSGISPLVVFVLSAIIGAIFAMTIAVMYWTFTKMVQSGSMNIRNAVSQIGEVYIPIPANKKGQGQVQLAIQGRIEEFDAITDDKSILPTGSKIMVLEVLKEGLLLVTAFKEDPLPQTLS